MVFEHIVKLQQEYTDKFVVVQQNVPELARFKGMTGTVRTVNMNGRALVEFDGNLNIGWFDIDLDYLKVIDAPLPKEDPKAKAKASPKAPAKQKKDAPTKPAGTAKPAAAAKGSVADILAAARGEKGGGSAAPAKPAGGAKMSVAEMLAAARSEKSGGNQPAEPAAAAKVAAKPAAKDARKMSVEEMLAAARGEKSGAAATSPAAASESPAADDAPAKESVRGAIESARRRATSAPPAAGDGNAPAKVDRKSMSVEEMLAAARAEKSGGAAPVAAAPEVATPEEPVEAVQAPAAEEPAAAVADAPTGGEAGSKRDEITSVDDQVAYCRQVDG